MTDSPGLPPEQEHVRRLLADARHDGPTPPEVVARLDETLASLVSERGDAPLEHSGARSDDRPTPVVDLGARRRRMAGIGLLAAAAVVVAGVAVGQALPRMSGSEDAASSGGVAADSGGTERQLGEQSDDGGADSSSGGAEAPESMKSRAPLAGAPTVSTSDTDLDDRLAELRSVPSDTAGASQRGALLDLMQACDLRGIGQGRRLVVQVDGQDGLVVFRRPDGATQQAEVYVCGTPEPVRALTLPAP